MKNNLFPGFLSLLILVTISLYGCGDVNKEGAASVYPHPTGWVVATGGSLHPAAFHSSPDTCTECHGADLKGGISKVSCASCHPWPYGHPANWSAASSHGATAKAVPSAFAGLASCKLCHGADFIGGTSGQSCKSCHTTAPHPAQPWRGTTASATTHTTTAAGNAAECARCHLNNQRLTTPQNIPAGTTPGCYNNTLCHGAASGHPVGWSAPNSHGVAAKAATTATTGLSSCKPCHGESFNTPRAGNSCVSCHGVAAPHPPQPWFGSTYTHSNTDTSNAAACAACHTAQANLSLTGAGRLPAIPSIGATGCYNNTLCHGVMGHSTDPQPWGAAANHGARAKLNPGSGNGFSTCQQCHGTAFDTDRGGSTCFSCHTTAPHPIAANWRSTGTITHTNTGVNNATTCAGCHTSATANLALPYSAWFANSPAGSFKVATTGCYTANLCHGDVTKTSNCDACHSIATTAPFKSLSGATLTSDAKVGAHVKHLSAAVLSANVSCTECHTVPASPAAAGTHRNLANDLTFGTLAKTGSLTPTFTAATGACANTYCHGANLGGGSNKVPVWNQTNYNTGCGTCHGFPPPAPHSTSSDCNNCHSNVNATNNGFVSANQHINGTVEASGGHTFPYPGSAHRTATGIPGTCASCHDTTSATGTYPVASGTAPICAGCHITALFAGCSDCHGDLITGRPNGITFPNRGVLHSTHGGNSCTECHPFTSGDARHGWSNGVKSTAAQVGGAGTFIGSWNPVTKVCIGCHGGDTWQ